MNGPPGGGVSRRSLLKLLGVGAAAGTLPLTTAGCGSGAASGATTLRWLANKPEVLAYFDDLATQFNASQARVFIDHDGTQASIVPQFVRGVPPDVACYNYNLETSNYVRGGVLADLADRPAAQQINPSYQALVDQYATYEGQTSVLPWSVTAAGVIYNVQLFADNGVEVPTTYPELLAACQRFQAAGVTPIYTTARDVWTLGQGMWDYATGSGADVPAFFKAKLAEGDTSGKPTFLETFRPVMTNVLELRRYFNPDFPSKTYADGNLAMGQGRVAMYLQGPWALGEIAKTDPDLELGTFSLPMTEDPDDRAVRVNLDLAMWVPTASADVEGALAFVDWMMTPEVCATYNQKNLAFSPLLGAQGTTDPRTAGLAPYLEAGRIYQGAGTFVPNTIPLWNYFQGALLDGDGDGMLRILDADWDRLAKRSALA
ncbi:carbohydrate ABC transporter substrate-binding protein, CUT1 family [Quadrisphaera granulorum]|uniref:Carbohydrate ABC transporter substrate-binding protein (CUT1 family) n=1 Tax=Quadrisphaera granulorum TaxID=317664 RepID=A0A315ZUQ2_9ACTN|nr:ABC transporter substrate-binding protein [Quadrisphaera granulorum]PWJ49069.1 carbohydrate ABC transporter substrate-binding protein (CUT1 family) [Quadrisphaera granulorum]SZE98279.1 carbohydrate ABC transporter substrate-binding protein, CUT1 family [Quadrisphaera granulorum]